ncbi:MAG: crossover junction endodeoxyribonuclease RuvC, partial [Patescibacteria group bacterium]
MRILGIDPGTGRLGFGVIDYRVDGSLVLVDGGVITTPANSEEASRLVTINGELEEIIKTHKPHVMAVEKLFFMKNVTTAMSVSQARGVVLLLGKQNGLDIFEYTPLQIKQSV